MSDKLLLVIFLILGSVSHSAEKSTFSCNKVVYGFINGIDNMSERESSESAELISQFLKIKDVNTIFNQSKGKYEDIKKSIKQKIDEKLEEDSWYDALNRLKLRAFQKILDSKQNNEKSIVEKIKFLKKKGALVVFSHSQGNLYANDSCGKLGKGSFHNIQIATPADKIKCSDFLSYTSIHSDLMIGLANLAETSTLIISGTKLNPPLKTTTPQIIESVDKRFAHSMTNYLLNPPSLMKIKNDHEEMIKKLNYEKSVVKLKDKEEINCRNIASYVDEKIEINKDQTGLVLGKTVKFSNYDNIEIEKIDDDTNLYQVSKFNRYAWVATIFQWISVALLLMFLPSILYFMGSIMITMGDSDKAQREKEQDRYQ